MQGKHILADLGQLLLTTCKVNMQGKHILADLGQLLSTTPCTASYDYKNSGVRGTDYFPGERKQS